LTAYKLLLDKEGVAGQFLDLLYVRGGGMGGGKYKNRKVQPVAPTTA